MVMVQGLRLKVSINRIATFLSEPEVDDEISSLKQGNAKLEHQATNNTIADDGKFGILNGFFLWNAPNEEEEKVDEAPMKHPWWRTKFWVRQAAAGPLPSAVLSRATSPAIPSANPGEDSEPIVDASTLASGALTPRTTSAITKHQFELQDINVLFPSGELSLITGATGCGKTALLRASKFVHEMGIVGILTLQQYWARCTRCHLRP
jgi:ABC-type multidrug transport system fused ATPase/permease subunit